MIYVYPKLSKYDLGIVRLGGAGLGNLLFTYGRALVYAQENGYQLSWPTWASVKIGPYIRNEKDKRFYGNLFQNRTGCVGGLKKIWLLCTHKKIAEELAGNVKDGQIVIFEKYVGTIEPFRQESDLIRTNLLNNMRDRDFLHSKLLDQPHIAAHIRLGDFQRATESELASGKENCSTPVSWYAKMIKKLRAEHNDEKLVLVYSDGTDEELQEVLELPNVQRVFWGNALKDMVAMSKADLLLASGSTFSLWARFLGRLDAIAYPGQLREKIALDGENIMERECL